METVHLFSGYVLARNRVRASCSCGFTTGPAPAQRSARRELLRDHHLTRTVCEGCGRGDPRSLPVGLPTFLVVRAGDDGGRPRVVCAPGSGGCDESPYLVPVSGSAVLETDPRVGMRDAPNELRTIARAEGVLMAFHSVSAAEAGERLAARARRADINVLEAANRVLKSISGHAYDSAGTTHRARGAASRRG